MIKIPSNLIVKKNLWFQSIPNITVFLERRNYTFQHQLNDEIFFYINIMKQEIHFFLFLSFRKKWE